MPIAEDGGAADTNRSTNPNNPATKSPGSAGPPTALISGVVLGVLALGAIALAVFFITRRRKRKMMESKASAIPANPPSPDEKSFQPGLIEQMRRHHLSVPRELTAGEVAAELAGYMPEPLPKRPVELSGDAARHAPQRLAKTPVELCAGEMPVAYGRSARSSQRLRPEENMM